MSLRMRVAVALVVAVAAALSTSAAPALATVGWNLRSFAVPTHFYASDKAKCENNVEEECDRYQILLQNTGSTPSSGILTLSDKLPNGITTLGAAAPVRSNPDEKSWGCPEAFKVVKEVKCYLNYTIAPGAYAAALEIRVSAPAEGVDGTLRNEVSVKGGETASAPSASTTDETEVSPLAPAFEIDRFSLEPASANGSELLQAGGHPSELVANIELPSIRRPPPAHGVGPVEQIKDVVVELPAGFYGDPLAVPRCPLSDTGNYGEAREQLCAAKGSTVGALAILDGGHVLASELDKSIITDIYNEVPESGYAGEFGVGLFEIGANVYASVARSRSGYRLRVSSPGLNTIINASALQLAFFGDAAGRNGLGGSDTAFLTNPADCSQGPLTAKVEVDSWAHPERWVSNETTMYPQIEDCNLLQFEPSFEMAPSSSGEEGTFQADEPSGYSVDLKVPQKSLFEEAATPDLKDASVTLPQGVSVSPSAADGLEGCAEHGPHGIDIPNDEGRHPDEAGEGEELGPDGLAHLVAGHCPAASTLGTVEIVTPLLEQPLKGHVYLAQPKCGDEGQPPCTEASATNGELYGLYIEAEGSGVVVKLPGKVAADPGTGRLTATFTENPQFPFSELRMHFHGGPRAPIANPQACGSYATSSTLTSSAGQESSGLSPSFATDWNGTGGACPSSLPFAPSFSAGTTSATAGRSARSPAFSRRTANRRSRG